MIQRSQQLTPQQILAIQQHDQIHQKGAKSNQVVLTAQNIYKIDTYSKLVTILTKLCSIDPQLSRLYQGTIRNYSSDELKKIIIKIINKFQQSQISEEKEAPDRAYLENKAEQNWQNFYKQAFETKIQSWNYLEDHLIGMKHVDKGFINGFKRALIYFNIYNNVYFNKNTLQIESLDFRNKTGTSGKKLTMHLFWQILDLTLPELTNINISQDGKQLKRNMIRQSSEFKLIQGVINFLSTQKRINKNKRKIKQLSNGKEDKKQSINKLASKFYQKTRQYIADDDYFRSVNSLADASGSNIGYYPELQKLNQSLGTNQILSQNVVRQNSNTRDLVNLAQNLHYLPAALNERINAQDQTLRNISRNRDAYKALNIKPRKF